MPVRPEQDWTRCGKTVEQLAQELRSFENQQLEVRLSVDGRHSSLPVSLVSKVDDTYAMLSNEEERPSSITHAQCGDADAQSAALVLFSGGQDSAVCLAWALGRYARVETVGFDYGQRHAVELQCREQVLDALRVQFPQWSAKLGADHLLPIPVLGAMSETSLTREVAIEMEANNLPNTFVPGRNLLFLTLAAALAYRRGIRALVTGVCETDYSGYPDCRASTMHAMQQSLNLGMEADFCITTPLMHLSKAQTWQMAQQLGGSALIELIRTQTHSCYLGERTMLHPWGYGCGHCPACSLRARGWQEFTQSLSTSSA